MRKRSVGAIVAIALFAILGSNIGALAESLWWTPSTEYTTALGSSGSFTAAEMATMTFYVRVNKPNPRDNVVNATGWYYLGETRNGVLSYPADNSLASLMRSYGFGGQTIQLTVSQAFKGTDGVERDSPQSVPISWVVPVPPPPPVTPKQPGGCLIK